MAIKCSLIWKSKEPAVIKVPVSWQQHIILLSGIELSIQLTDTSYRQTEEFFLRSETF